MCGVVQDVPVRFHCPQRPARLVTLRVSRCHNLCGNGIQCGKPKWRRYREPAFFVSFL